MTRCGGMGLLAGALALLLASCSDSGPSGRTVSPEKSSQEQGIDPCALLTSEEIEAALGWKVATAEATGHGATGSCKYSSATPYSARGLQQLFVVVGRGAPSMNSSEAMAKWRLDQYSGEAYKNMKPVVQPVDGLGVPAIRNGTEGMFGIEMSVGDRLVTMSLFDSPEPARTLAAKVLKRLK
jgi:hypothetical protein